LNSLLRYSLENRLAGTPGPGWTGEKKWP
jgi:hypothetical protein